MGPTFFPEKHPYGLSSAIFTNRGALSLNPTSLGRYGLDGSAELYGLAHIRSLGGLYRAEVGQFGLDGACTRIGRDEKPKMYGYPRDEGPRAGFYERPVLRGDLYDVQQLSYHPPLHQ